MYFLLRLGKDAALDITDLLGLLQQFLNALAHGGLDVDLVWGARLDVPVVDVFGHFDLRVDTLVTSLGKL